MAKGRIRQDWEKQHSANIEKYSRQLKQLFEKMAGDAAVIGAAVDKVNPDRPFSFADYPQTKKRADKLIKGLNDEMSTIIVNGVRSSWTLANNKNNELARAVFGNSIGKLSKAEYARYFNNNGVALDAFLKRKESGLNLSDRVWKYSQQFKKEIEFGLDLGIGNGLSAHEMTRDLKQYLQHPDKLFRRVRDKHGNLQLSKAAQAFHPGRGVYRSSYKNAMRLSRTENNMAYKASDYERWNQFDFVVGLEIRLSNNPNHCPLCESLAGKYPKTFKFVGWHPQCRCAALPILKTPDELAAETKQILAGEPTSTASSKEITDLPSSFNNWYANNKTRLDQAVSKPYWLRDNAGLIGAGANSAATSGLSASILIPKNPVGDKAVYEKITDTENEIRKNKAFETAVVYDKNGNIILDKRGQATSVSFTDRETDLFKDAILTHNHPRGWGYEANSMQRIGNSFSMQDITIAIKHDMAEIRAVTPNYTFVMRRPENGWGVGWTTALIEMGNINNTIKRDFERRLRKNTTTVKKASTVHYHILWKRFAEQYGIEYIKKKTA